MYQPDKNLQKTMKKLCQNGDKMCFGGEGGGGGSVDLPRADDTNISSTNQSGISDSI